MKTMVTPAEALSMVLENVRELGAEKVGLENLLGRTLAADIVPQIELPPFDNSAMDGYALLAADSAGASESSPVKLKINETIAAGGAPQNPIIAGHCAQVMTGAPMPPGADAVIMREDTRRVDDATVELLAEVRRGSFVRKAGSDVRVGETVMHRGDVVGAAQWGMLASLGLAEVSVSRVPRVALITTGAELMSTGQEVGPGQIRDSNSYTMHALALSCGAEPYRFKTGDDPEALRALLIDCAEKYDAIVTSGGVSAGDFDPVRDVLPEVGRALFWKIAMKPGKPVMFATMRDGAVPVFALPGNPVSVMVGFEEFVRPGLLAMQGRACLKRQLVRARIANAICSPEGRTEYVRARVWSDKNGEWQAEIHGDQGSGRLSTMTRANALLVVDAETTEVAAGDLLMAQMIDWPEVK